ncbi:MAG: hypothetical protein V4665_03655 [Patescibacteria group bacterium]
MNKKPYIVSADIYLLLKKWAERKNLILPSEEFFSGLRNEFSTYMLTLFHDFEFISEEEIFRHMSEVTHKNDLPVVSLDPVYFQGDYSLELTRNVNLNGEDRGLKHRFGSHSLLKQLSLLKETGVKDVCLVDDVIFSGVLTERVIQSLSHLGISVPVVCAGIGIQEGINRITTSSRSIYCLKTYRDVMDEVCERDFYLGVPYSGRSLCNSQNIGLPYVLPYGNPDKWASIPVLSQKPFSRFCIDQTIILFEEIEKSSERIIDCSDIERKVFDQPEKGRYVEFLKSIYV